MYFMPQQFFYFYFYERAFEMVEVGVGEMEHFYFPTILPVLRIICVGFQGHLDSKWDKEDFSKTTRGYYGVVGGSLVYQERLLYSGISLRKRTLHPYFSNDEALHEVFKVFQYNRYDIFKRRVSMEWGGKKGFPFS